MAIESNTPMTCVGGQGEVDRVAEVIYLVPSPNTVTERAAPLTLLALALSPLAEEVYDQLPVSLP